MMINRIQQDLDGQGFTVGSWLNLGSPLAAEVMVSVGFGWLCVDAEHGPIGLSEVTHLIRAIESRGGTPIVRIPDHDSATIGRILDAGALGIVAPHVRTEQEARHIARSCRYTPRGHRSAGSGRAITLSANYEEQINDHIVVIAQIEDREGIKNSAAIVGVDGIDIGFLGPKDLSLEMDEPMGSPEHEQAMAQLLVACKQVGKPAGIPIANGTDLANRRQQGFVFFDLTSDLRMLQHRAAAELKVAMGK